MIPSLESLGEKLSELTASTVDPDEALSLQIDSLTLVEFVSLVEEVCDVVVDLAGIDSSTTLRNMWQRLAVDSATRSVR